MKIFHSAYTVSRIYYSIFLILCQEQKGSYRVYASYISLDFISYFYYTYK